MTDIVEELGPLPERLKADADFLEGVAEGERRQAHCRRHARSCRRPNRQGRRKRGAEERSGADPAAASRDSAQSYDAGSRQRADAGGAGKDFVPLTNVQPSLVAN